MLLEVYRSINCLAFSEHLCKVTEFFPLSIKIHRKYGIWKRWKYLGFLQVGCCAGTSERYGGTSPLPQTHGTDMLDGYSYM